MAMMMKPGRVGVHASRRATTSMPLRRSLVTRAQVEQKSGLAKFSDSIGLPTDDGVFGFTPFAEMWVGRWAQIGFVSSMIAEFATGRGTLQQVGLPSPSTPVLAAILLILGGATIAGTVRTVQRATSKQMSRSEIERYKTFLGLTKEDDWKEEAMLMKKRGDFTTPGNNNAAIAASRAQGTPVDGFLSTNEVAEGQQAAQEMKASGSTVVLTKEQEAAEVAVAEAEMKKVAAEKEVRARQYAETMYYGQEAEMEYARGIEITNGRWAMVGFLAAILVEAYSGQGIIAQGVTICKWSGLLGDKSGF